MVDGRGGVGRIGNQQRATHSHALAAPAPRPKPVHSLRGASTPTPFTPNGLQPAASKSHANTFRPPGSAGPASLVPAKRSASPASSSSLSATPTLHFAPDDQGAHPPSDENLNPYDESSGSKAKKPRLSDDSGYGDAAGDDKEMDVEIPDSVDGDAHADDLLGLGGSWRDAEAFPAAPIAAPAPPPPQPGPAQSSLDALKTSLLGFQAKQIHLMDKVIEAMGSKERTPAVDDELAYLEHNMSYVKQRVAELQAEIARQTLNPSPRRVPPPSHDSALRPPPLQVQARSPRSNSVPSSNSSSDTASRVSAVQERTVVASTSRQQLSPVTSAVVSSHFVARAATSAAKPFDAPRPPPPEPPSRAPVNAKGKGRENPTPPIDDGDLEALFEGVDFEDDDDILVSPAHAQPAIRPTAKIANVDDEYDEDDEPLVVTAPRRNQPPPIPPQRPLPPAPRQVVMIDRDPAHPGQVKSIAPSGARNGPPPGLAVVLPPKGGHPWSNDVFKALKQRFGLVGFRKNQEEAVNATLSGKDVFVLLPTGGGKSLCFQLPAVVQSGKTHGVTIVISPLLSLISDQCKALFDKDIPAVFINGSMSKADKDHAIATLRSGVPSCYLAYVTPEQIVKSDFFRGILRELHRRGQLARFVLDEAHCVSSWGHDFRPDYKAMGALKHDFAGVPLMALTATATDRVRQDVISNLGMDRPLVLTASFNRPNLKYEVRPKTKGFVNEIIAFVQQHKRECGIIYCASQKLCEETAQKLRDVGKVEARHYHAGMAPGDRLRIQKGWQDDSFPVICATIAFGMGIDKPDVRYVIHYALPQTLEGYYQETGRAGRDGEPSTCILYYAFHDTQLLYRLIDDGDSTQAQKENNKDNVRRVVQFCINETDCRRMQVLSYFNEAFDPRDCHKTCDNCMTPGGKPKSDVTAVAQDAVGLVRSIEGDQVTMLYAVDVFYGSKAAKIRAAGHDENEYAGKGSAYQRGDIERLFQLLAAEDVFSERLKGNALGFTNAYIKLGKKANDLSNNRKRIMMALSNETGKKKGAPLPAPRRRADPNEDFAHDDEVENDEAPLWNPAARKPVAFKRKAAAATAAQDPHTGCYEDLVEARAKAAKTKKVSPESLFPDDVLQALSLILPTNEQQFFSIDDLEGKTWRDFVDIGGRTVCRKWFDRIEDGQLNAGPSKPAQPKPSAKVTRPPKASAAAGAAAITRNKPPAKAKASSVQNMNIQHFMHKEMAPAAEKVARKGAIAAMPLNNPAARRKKL